MQHQIQSIEMKSLNAWPALQQILYDGWVLRFGRGYTGRANSVTALYDGRIDVREKIDYAQARYAEHNQPALFRITPTSRPESLDAVLAERGYRKFNRTLVRTRSLEQLPPADPADSGISIDSFDRPGVQWLEPYTAFSGTPLEHVPALRQILRNIAPRTRFALLSERGEPTACAMLVLEGGDAGVFDLVTRQRSRRRGHATTLITHLLNWAAAHGAARAYVQQLEKNEAAGRFFERIGFAELYQYYYRVRVDEPT